MSSTLSTWNDYSRAYSGLPINCKYLLYIYVYYKAEPEKLFQSVQELQKCVCIQIWAHFVCICHLFPCVLLGPKNTEAIWAPWLASAKWKTQIFYLFWKESKLDIILMIELQQRLTQLALGHFSWSIPIPSAQWENEDSFSSFGINLVSIY